MMEKDGITGKRVTPYLLDKLVGLTGGNSLKTNMALIENNARVGGLLAAELDKISTDLHVRATQSRVYRYF